MATQTQILEVLETLTSIYNTEPGEPKGYYWALEEYDADILEAAAKDTVRFCKWYPRPSELREIAERKQQERDKDDEPRRMYWRKMSLFNDLLAGRIESDSKLEALFEFEELVCETPAA